MRGFGRIFLRHRPGCAKGDGCGCVWWLAYSHRGKEYRESAKSAKESDATRLLKKRLGEIGRGRLVGPTEERVTFEDLAADFINDYTTNGRRSIVTARNSVRHLAVVFGDARALDIKPDRVRAYIASRQDDGASNASINRELAALKRMFSLAVEAEKLTVVPHVPMLKENNARQGFLDPADFERLRAALPEYLRDPVAFLYLSGWRAGEMRTLEWRDVDLPGRVVRLRPENSKSEDARTLPLTEDRLAIIERARVRRRLDCAFVFHVQGRPIGDIRKAWKRACAKVGLADLIVHDLRRSAVRNLIRAGIPESVAMAFTGHKTRSVFDRYSIVDEADLTEAAEKLQAYVEEAKTRSVVVPIRTAAVES